jgi:hypothetical protein
VELRQASSVYRPAEEKLSSVVTLERLERLRAKGVDVQLFLGCSGAEGVLRGLSHEPPRSAAE